MGRPHHPLESPAVAGGTVAIPGGDTARQDALNCASVKVCEGFRGQAKFLQPAEVLLRRLRHTVCVGGPFQLVSDEYAEELEKLSTFSTAVQSMWIGVCSLRCSLKSTTSWSHTLYLLLIAETDPLNPCHLSTVYTFRLTYSTVHSSRIGFV